MGNKTEDGKIELKFLPGDKITCTVMGLKKSLSKEAAPFFGELYTFTTAEGTGEDGEAVFTGMIPEDIDIHGLQFYYGDVELVLDEYGGPEVLADYLAEQTAVENSFDPKAHFMCSEYYRSADINEEGDLLDGIRFSSIHSFVKFTAPCDLEKVVFSGNNEELVAGTFSFYTLFVSSDEYPGYDSKQSYTITLSGNIEKGKEYYIAIPDIPFKYGVSLYLYKADGSMGYYSHNEQITPPYGGVHYINRFGDLSGVDFSK